MEAGRKAGDRIRMDEWMNGWIDRQIERVCVCVSVLVTRKQSCIGRINSGIGRIDILTLEKQACTSGKDPRDFLSDKTKQNGSGSQHIYFQSSYL